MERESRRRRRPALSCLECRRRKIKCDRNDPCAHCVSTKSPCSYKTFNDKSVFQPQPQQGAGSWRLASSLSASPLALAEVQQTSTNNSISEHGNHPSGPRIVIPPAVRQDGIPNALGRDDTRPTESVRATEPDLRDLFKRVQKLEESSASNPIHGLSQTGRDILARQCGLQDSQIILNKTRILRWSHWMGTAQEFVPIIACYDSATSHDQDYSIQDPETRALLTQMGELLQKCKDLARRIKAGRPSGCLSCLEFNLVPPSREVADKMVTVYVRSFESTYRILHIPSFWADYQRFWNNPGRVAIDLRLKILLIIGIGASLSNAEDLDVGFRTRVYQWIHAAQTWLSGPLKKDRLEITGLQVYCLTILARQIFSIGGDLVWMSTGSLIHRAMQMGLHRDPKHLPAMSVLQAELRRRLWATILELVVQSSLDSAMPPRISFDEFDTDPPANNNDEEIDESTTVLQPNPRSTYTATSMQLILLDSLPTRLRILQLLSGLQSELCYLDVLKLSSEITETCRAYNNFLNGNEASGVSPFHRNLLDFLVRRFLIPLHCPFARKARTNPLFNYSLNISLDTAMAIVSPEPDEGFSRLMVIGGGLFSEGVRCAITAISFELIAQTEAQSLAGTLHRNSQHRELLKQALQDLILSSLERIRQGETNIKMHMFLCMIMALVEATEAGTSRQRRIAQSGKDSLELCHNILKAMVSTVPLPSSSDTFGLTSLGGGQEDYELDLEMGLFFPDEGFA
ncbi:hypothetical protein CONLIGDRAFT_615196 [Coniochaeta ligniaria NRRL 30616]|uniref:Zn(2)-C6 fungal-type domain-containing protein n=1 Tax=Coniochaeta ligniaria NRRL 30616 TaxID=1408157 RepID=A0A1J7IPB5_9PEZI|nr:hypothetical protein CONLIGDRAFT_615196 [Coniochaeta ligniaria NRRL 30616]